MRGRCGEMWQWRGGRERSVRGGKELNAIWGREMSLSVNMNSYQKHVRHVRSVPCYWIHLVWVRRSHNKGGNVRNWWSWSGHDLTTVLGCYYEAKLRVQWIMTHTSFTSNSLLLCIPPFPLSFNIPPHSIPFLHKPSLSLACLSLTKPTKSHHWVHVSLTHFSSISHSHACIQQTAVSHTVMTNFCR